MIACLLVAEPAEPGDLGAQRSAFSVTYSEAP